MSYTNNTKTDLNWKLYKVEGTALGNLDPGCKLVTADAVNDSSSHETRYYYNNTGTKDAEYNGKCTLTNDSLTSEISSGTFSKETSSSTQITGQSGFSQTIDTDGSSAYYYLVIEYPNDNGESDNQNDDMGQTISATITVADEVTSKVKAQSVP